jgi:hypothetical protein
MKLVHGLLHVVITRIIRKFILISAAAFVSYTHVTQDTGRGTATNGLIAHAHQK